MKNMKKFQGYTITEVLIALLVLGIAAPASIGALGSALTAELRIRERVSMASAAEWWFGRLKLPAGESAINASPSEDEAGKFRFHWETEILHSGAILVTLRVSGRVPGSEFIVSRIF